MPLAKEVIYSKDKKFRISYIPDHNDEEDKNGKFKLTGDIWLIIEEDYFGWGESARLLLSKTKVKRLIEWLKSGEKQ